MDVSAYLPPPRPTETPDVKRDARLKTILMVIGGAAGGALAAIGAPRAYENWGDWLPEIAPWWALGFALLSLWPNIVIHEAGHALAGISRGMRPLAVGIGPLRWDYSQSGWRFRRGDNVAGIGGFVALLPVGERGLSRTDQAIYLLGGPLANLFTAAIAIYLLLRVDSGPIVAAFLLGTGAGALFLGVLNLIPFYSQGWSSDGRGLWDLARRNPTATLLQQMNRLNALIMAGMRPRDWPSALIPDPIEADAVPAMMVAQCNLVRLSWAMDSGQQEQAARAALRVTQYYHQVPEGLQPHMALAMATYAARCVHNYELLAAWRPLCEGGLMDLSLPRAWLDAELAAHAGESAALREALSTARQLMPRAPDPVTGLLLDEYLDDLAKRLPT